VDTEQQEDCDLADKNGVKLDRNHVLSTDATAQIYCTTACKFPSGIVF
jgi:hypothetical protein